MVAATFVSSLYFLLFQTPIHTRPLADFSALKTHCEHIRPIHTNSYIERQDRLAQTLHSLGAAAYIAEPGASAAYYANLSSSLWHLSERPLLLLITPTEENGTITGNVTILTPLFEATRAKLLPIPSDNEIAFPEWAEDVNPYQIAVSAIPQLQSLSGTPGKIFVDGYMRNFVVDGLLEAAGENALVTSAPVEIKRLRERKSEEELEIMKCANEVTLLAVRAVRRQLYIGIQESEARTMMRGALDAAGLADPDAIVLFGPDAALPHGSGTDRALQQTDFVLIDCGGNLFGYYSDLTRTFALEESSVPIENLDIWGLVYDAQAAAFAAAHNGTITADVDAAARDIIKLDGYGRYFTHRLGHGIGLEVHESPYLRGGSDDVILSGHTFSDEPGIYIEGQIGVRLEDCFYIAEDGSAVFLTAGVGGPGGSPWEP
ncbi:peptidase M24, structural domain-containing protein [Cytidiella melzeri]|nr:peptidase M24, structural domain-containing protein [Cytidiella melzeri]